MFKKTFTAALLVAATAVSALPAAAQQISFGISGETQEERDLIRGGLIVYQLANGGDPGQVLGQALSGNVGVVHQDGNGHNGSLTQSGQGQSGGVFQFGNNTDAHLNQGGNGDSDLLFVFGLN